MKRAIKLLTTVIVAVGMATTAFAEEEISISVNRTSVSFPDAKPFIENDLTFVPLRAVFEALGAVVEWLPNEQTVLSYDPISKKSITMQIGRDYLFLNDNRIEMEAASKIIDDSTVIPVRAIAESLECDVEWSEETKTVMITRNENFEDKTE